MPSIANIDIKGVKKGKPKLKSDSGFILPFYQTKNTLNLDSMNAFIKGCEKLIRSSDAYKNYKSHLMSIGLNHCMVLSNIVDEEDAPIEMHHGPILTLYDYCRIVIQALLKREQKITSYRIAYIVLKEHELENVQTVMLCETVHKLVHAKEMYLNVNQAHGNLENFLERYRDGVDEETERIIKLNLELSREFHSTDRGILELNDYVSNWSK